MGGADIKHLSLYYLKSAAANGIVIDIYLNDMDSELVDLQKWLQLWQMMSEIFRLWSLY